MFSTKLILILCIAYFANAKNINNNDNFDESDLKTLNFDETESDVNLAKDDEMYNSELEDYMLEDNFSNELSMEDLFRSRSERKRCRACMKIMNALSDHAHRSKV